MKRTSPLSRIPTELPIVWSILILSLVLSGLMQAQDDASVMQPPVPAHRPRIGLALSGGGALGLAEIGVIQWMEENHIPVDRIAGTSMGSIIGAMYATGMTPAEIQEFAEKIDWDEAFLPGTGLHAAFFPAQTGSPRLSDQCASRPEARIEWPERLQLGSGSWIVTRPHRVSRVRCHKLRRSADSISLRRHRHAERRRRCSPRWSVWPKQCAHRWPSPVCLLQWKSMAASWRTAAWCRTFRWKPSWHGCGRR